MDPKWLNWSKHLQAIAQTGLTYTKDPFDIERYKAIQAVAVEIVASYTDEDVSYIRGLFDMESGYATPKVDVRGVVLYEDAILLVKERVDHLWTLPGGWADINESPSEAVVREIFEESGYQTRAVKVLAIYDRNKHGHPPIPYHAYKIFFQCNLLGGVPSNSSEIEAVGFFKEDGIPPLSTTRTTLDQINRLFEHLRHPDWPTDFD